MRAFSELPRGTVVPVAGTQAAQVAAIVVDPTALNALTAAVTKQTGVIEDLREPHKDLDRTFDHMAIDLGRIWEELCISRKIVKRG